MKVNLADNFDNLDKGNLIYIKQNAMDEKKREVFRNYDRSYNPKGQTELSNSKGKKKNFFRPFFGRHFRS